MSARTSENVLRRFMDARVHLGHKTRVWNPRMAPFILGVRNGMHIINLDKTVVLMADALRFARELTASGGRIYWLGPREETQHDMLVSIAERTPGAIFQRKSKRWIGGMFTNAAQMGTLQRFGNKLPDALFVMDARKNRVAIAEANVMSMQVIAVLDTDCDPKEVQYPIPGNDESSLALHLYMSMMSHAMTEGHLLYRKTKQSRTPRAVASSSDSVQIMVPEAHLAGEETTHAERPVEAAETTMSETSEISASGSASVGEEPGEDAAGPGVPDMASHEHARAVEPGAPPATRDDAEGADAGSALAENRVEEGPSTAVEDVQADAHDEVSRTDHPNEVEGVERHADPGNLDAEAIGSDGQVVESETGEPGEEEAESEHRTCKDEGGEPPSPTP
ncbi:30S ribosomal protein S2 [Porphyridium purpureum]|uniref:30S ribosomal protein S2 n=1 Tax=Porphyridium purpureum TaxID=35688 RepID=A0A5J4Z1M7_PORPP|nr:30S ribosomal protein S2 [Porphyridium purpureum]|eukprot:POR5366..scf208_2